MGDVRVPDDERRGRGPSRRRFLAGTAAAAGGMWAAPAVTSVAGRAFAAAGSPGPPAREGNLSYTFTHNSPWVARSGRGGDPCPPVLGDEQPGDLSLVTILAEGTDDAGNTTLHVGYDAGQCFALTGSAVCGGSCEPADVSTPGEVTFACESGGTIERAELLLTCGAIPV